MKPYPRASAELLIFLFTLCCCCTPRRLASSHFWTASQPFPPSSAESHFSGVGVARGNKSAAAIDFQDNFSFWEHCARGSSSSCTSSTTDQPEFPLENCLRTGTSARQAIVGAPSPVRGQGLNTFALPVPEVERLGQWGAGTPRGFRSPNEKAGPERNLFWAPASPRGPQPSNAG